MILELLVCVLFGWWFGFVGFAVVVILYLCSRSLVVLVLLGFLAVVLVLVSTWFGFWFR